MCYNITNVSVRVQSQMHLKICTPIHLRWSPHESFALDYVLVKSAIIVYTIHIFIQKICLFFKARLYSIMSKFKLNVYNKLPNNAQLLIMQQTRQEDQNYLPTMKRNVMTK